LARFVVKKSLATPLRIQLGTSAEGNAEIVRVVACGEKVVGSASRPVLSRPSTPGKGTGQIRSLNGISVPTSTAITTFSSAPSYPLVVIGSFNLPIVVDHLFPYNGGIVLASSSYVLLYAYSAGGHTWTGALEWEED
jgi:hypothetical protein